MKCKRARELMGAYLYGDLTPEQMRELRLHVSDCEQCREDLRTRGIVVSSLDTEVPQLDESERQRIAWSVKGAVKAQARERRVFGFRIAPTFAVAAILIAFILTGAWITTRQSEPAITAEQVQKDGAQENIVKVQPAPEPANTNGGVLEQNGEKTASTPQTPDDQPAIVIDRIPIVPAARVIARPTHRSMENPERPKTVIPDAPLPVVQDIEDMPEAPAKEETTLPEPSDLNDAQIANPSPEELSLIHI